MSSAIFGLNVYEVWDAFFGVFVFKPIPSVIALCFAAVLVVTAFAGDVPWRAVSPAELAMTTSSVEANADAEILFWEVRVNDSSQNVVEEHYLRIKIFTENGREKYSKIDIPYVKGIKIKEVQARVIKPGGQISELAQTDIFEREIVKANDVKVKAVSFAVPNIEPGVIVEYRYKEVASNSAVGSMPVYFQHDIPVRDYKFYFKPFQGRQVKWLSFNADDSKFVKAEKGFYVASMTNIPALKDEPFMPPSDQVRAWLLIFSDSGSSDSYWARFAGWRDQWYKSFQPSKDVINILPQIIGNASTPEEKISRIFQFCKKQIHNVTYDPALSPDERSEISDDIKNAKDALKGRRGSSIDINTLFGALVTAAGYEARYVYTGNRSKFYFNPSHANARFVHLSVIAVNAGSGWNFYDPGSYFTPEGMLSWHDEKEYALMLGKDSFIWTTTPLSGYEKTASNRTARFKLLEDGTLEGTVNGEYTGHFAENHKLINYDDSQNRREERLKNSIKSRMSTAEVSGIKIENSNDPEKPFTYEYSIRVPNYAQKTGKRLFLQPGFFEYGVKPVFSSSTRKYDIAFSYPWKVNDNISIEYPEGFELDSPDTPADVADPRKIGSLKISIGVNKVTRTLYYKRDFHFGNGSVISFPAAFYSNIKNLFDGFHSASAHTITLRQN